MAGAARKRFRSRTPDLRRLTPAAFVAFALLPGVGPSDPRIGADPHQMPWSALGRLQIPGVGRCTAVMVAPHWAVTAAHCLGIRVLGHVAPPGAIHLLLGYRDGTFTRHLIPDRVYLTDETASDSVQPEMGGHRGRDLALLHFATSQPDTIPPEPKPLTPGTALALGGYGQDRTERLAVDPGCAVRGYGADPDGSVLLLHNCAGTRGSSGGAVLTQDSRGWHLAGVAVAAQRAGAGGVAVPGFTVLHVMTMAEAAMPG